MWRRCWDSEARLPASLAIRANSARARRRCAHADTTRFLWRRALLAFPRVPLTWSCLPTDSMRCPATKYMTDHGTRDDFLRAIDHIRDVLTKVTANCAPGGFLAEADIHTIAEGLLLAAFTHWEQFTRYLLIGDVAHSPSSQLHRDVQQFHDPEAPERLAIRILQHPDHPQKFVEWSNYTEVVSRANELLGAGNRFAASPLPRRNDLDLIKAVRNAIAHRSDKAWTRFLNLCGDPPFSIPPAQITGITPGRFLVGHDWNGQPVLKDTIGMLEASAKHLVP